MNGCDVLSPRLRQLYVHDIGAEDWRIAMTTDRVALVALELAAVAIHPYPVGLVSYFEQSLLRTPPRLSLSETELEIILALPMFLRFYLLGRAMMLHSRLFTDTASRSIGALNKVGVYASAAGGHFDAAPGPFGNLSGRFCPQLPDRLHAAARCGRTVRQLVCLVLDLLVCNCKVPFGRVTVRPTHWRMTSSGP